MGAQWKKREEKKKRNNKFNIRDIPKPFFQRGHAFNEFKELLYAFSIRSIRF